MKLNPSLVVAGFVAAALLPASSLAAPRRPSTGTGSSSSSTGERKPNMGGFIPHDQVQARAAQEFTEIRERIETDFKDNPKKASFLANVDRTEASFNKNANAILTRPGYGAWEFEHLGRQVTVVITAIRETAEIDAKFADDDPRKQQMLDATRQKAQEASEQVAAFTVQNLQAASLHAGGTPAAPADGGTGKIAAGGLHEAGQIRGRGGWWMDMPAEEALKRSQVVRLADECAKAAVEGREPVVTPPAPDPVWPQPGGPVVTNPSGGGSGAVQPLPPAPPPVDVISPIFTPGGRSQSYVDQGADALEGRDYAQAAALARRALALNPGNLSATAILQAAKGRGAAVDSSEAGMRTASAGAASLAPSGFDPGGVGGGGAPSGSFGGAVSPGASRLITEQAGNGVKNAMRLGDPQSALEIVNKALSQDPNNPSLLNMRSQVYGHLGRWEEALKDASAGLAIAVKGGKGEPLALLNSLARAQNRTRRYGDALATSERMLAADPNSAWAFANRAYARGGLGDKAAMMEDIGMAARLDPAFQRAAAEAAALTLPSSSDVLFLFPGEGGARPAAAPAPAGRGKSFGVVVGAGLVGGLLLALGLLSTVLAPLKNTVVSVFTKAKRTGPATTQAVATAQPASVAGNAGGLIRGQYEISRQIGQGGMGTVYEGTDRSLGRRVAIKKMRDELRVNARERDRFVIEAKTVASLHHPNIVDIYAIAEEGDDVYLVFEYVDGKTVHDLVQTKGRLDPAESVRVTRAMGEALTYAHSRGVIHRDMKPSNVMATASGQIKVMDFGIARMAKDALTRYSMTNTVVGTPPYMAPEQEQGVVRKESDVYSLAVCSYEMLTGKMPFIGIGAGMLMNKINMSYIPPSRAIAGLPEALDEVFVKAFQADPDRRYRTPQEFVTALAAAAGAGSKTV